MSNISDIIRQLAQGGRQTVSLVCTVDSVDKDARTVDCIPLDEGAPLLGVNLQANQESTVGVVVYPRVGSFVVVGFIADGSAGVVLLTDDIESVEVVISDKTTAAVLDENGVRINVGDKVSAGMSTDGIVCKLAGEAESEFTSAELNKNGIVFNGGTLRGLVKIEELEDNLNQLKQYVENLKSATSTGIKSVGAGTAASGPTGAGAFDAAMDSASINFKDMENKKVRQ